MGSSKPQLAQNRLFDHPSRMQMKLWVSVCLGASQLKRSTLLLAMHAIL